MAKAIKPVKTGNLKSTSAYYDPFSRSTKYSARGNVHTMKMPSKAKRK